MFVSKYPEAEAHRIEHIRITTLFDTLKVHNVEIIKKEIMARLIDHIEEYDAPLQKYLEEI